MTKTTGLAFGGVWGKLRPVNYLWCKSIWRSRYGGAIVAGLCLAAAFPKVGVAGLAWIAPALMVGAALGTRGAETFRIGYVAGLAHYLASLYWLLLIPYRWHGVPLGPAAGWVSLCAFLALFPATWVWLITPRGQAGMPGNLNPGCPTSPPQASSTVNSLTEFRAAGLGTGKGGMARNWAWRTLWALGGAALWVALEMVLARIMGGFSWNLLGTSQYGMVPLIQVASLTGVYGISFLVVWFSLSLLSAALMAFRRPTTRAVWAPEVFLPALTVALVFNFGFRTLKSDATSSRTLRVTLVQPSIPQTLIWDSNADQERFNELLRLSEQALTNRTDLLVWPEAAIPKLLRYDEETFTAITGLARRHHTWIIVGSDDFERKPQAADPREGDFYNSCFLISPEGKLWNAYRKRSLVIFGEYLPFTHWLPFLKWFTPIQGGFTPGKGPGRFELTNLDTELCVLICFEDIFPHLARSDLSPKTDFLVNLTNDGWFGESAAPWQHGVTGLFRAIENGMPLIRCTNTGLTCWIDAHGRLRRIFHDAQGTIYGPGFLTTEIPLPARGEPRPRTFYSQHGDWFGWACAAAGLLLATCRLKELFAWRIVEAIRGAGPHFLMKR